MKRLIPVFLLIALAGCKSSGVNKILYGGDTNTAAPKQASDYPMRTVACCTPIGDSTKAFCARLLGPEGTHENGEHYIVEGGYFNFPLRSVCDKADLK